MVVIIANGELIWRQQRRRQQETMREELVSGGQQGEEGEGPELGSCRPQRFERSLCISPVRDDDEPVLQIFPPFFKINCGDRQRWERSRVGHTGPDECTSVERDHGQTCCVRKDLTISENPFIRGRMYVSDPNPFPNLFPGSRTQKLRPEGFWDRGSAVGSQGCSRRQEPGSGG